MHRRHLELFSGTHSVGKCCERRGIEVVSLDRDLPNYDKLDKECTYLSPTHIKEDILTWNFKVLPNNYFTSISMSPVCLWSSCLRKCWIGSYYHPETGKFSRKPKEGYVTFTKEILQHDVNRFMKPMVDKCFEILEYFRIGNPNVMWWLENPKNSTMKDYIKENYPHYNEHTIVDYCSYGFPYKKSTRFWNNFCFKGNKCKGKNCDQMVLKCGKLRHKEDLGSSTFIVKDDKLIRVDTKEKRIQYKKELKEQKDTHYKKTGNSKLYRYRIPERLIDDMLDCIYPTPIEF